MLNSTSENQPLTYNSPKEVPVKHPTALNGTFDSERIAKISVVVEDKYDLPVSTNRENGIWQVPLESGFSQAGIRWLRLKGFDSNGELVSSQRVFVTVSSKPMIEGDSLEIKILRETYFKAAPISSDNLKSQEKARVKTSQGFKVTRYGFIKNHLKVELEDGAFGYFYEPHVHLTKGNNGEILHFQVEDLPKSPPGFWQIWIAHATKIKATPEPSEQLLDQQKQDLLFGEHFLVTGYACVEGHFRVTLSKSLPNFGRIGYLYAPHIRLLQDGNLVKFDPKAVNVHILKTTAFKKQPQPAAELSSSEKTTLTEGMVYGVVGYTWVKGHLKVSFSENLPDFGNTGYLYPDFVELRKGDKTIQAGSGLSYTKPKYAIAGEKTVLQGKFEPNTVATISALAENKYSLPVNINPNTGIWQVVLEKGFQQAGLRWLNFRGLNSNSELVDSQLVYITVSEEPLSEGTDLKLTTKRDTIFKMTPADSGALNSQQRTKIAGDKTFAVKQYGFVDGHLKVLLETPIAPVGEFGYFFEDHVNLYRGERQLVFDVKDVPTVEGQAQLLIEHTTFFKAQPKDAALLPANQKTKIALGTVFEITGYAAMQGHFRVTLAESVDGLGNVGYLYWRHVTIKKGDRKVAYDPEALTATMRQTTILKKQPTDSNQVSSSEKVTLPSGRVYGVSSYAIEENHLKTAMTEEFENFGNTGYLFPDHVLMRRGGKTFDPFPDQLEIDVPYFSQVDNPRYSWSTCNVTTLAMVFYFYGVRSQSGGQLEDELLQWCINQAGYGSWTSHNILSNLIKAYDFQTSFSTSRNWSAVMDELVNRRPVPIAGDFTASGHILCIIGYNQSGYIVNDPWGNAMTGYSDVYGGGLVYPYGYMDEVCGPDGNVWAHFIRP